MDPYLCCGCHCERSEAISSGNAHPDRDCFVAALLAMTQGEHGSLSSGFGMIPNPVDRNLCCGCHCERSEAISSGNAHPDRDCFVAALLAMTGRAWILIRFRKDWGRSMCDRDPPGGPGL